MKIAMGRGTDNKGGVPVELLPLAGTYQLCLEHPSIHLTTPSRCVSVHVFLGMNMMAQDKVHSHLIRLHVLKILKIASTLYEELYRYEGGMISGYAIDTSNNHIMPTC